MELIQEFPLAHPDLKCKINRIYNSSFNGSVLYDIFSQPVRQLINSWSVSVRQMWDLPFNSHKYCIEALGGTHAHTMFVSRFVSFIQNARKSGKLAVQLMLAKVLDNVNTITGKNLAHIQDMIGSKIDILNISSTELKKKSHILQS